MPEPDTLPTDSLPPPDSFARRVRRLAGQYFNGKEKRAPGCWPPACWR